MNRASSRSRRSSDDDSKSSRSVSIRQASMNQADSSGSYKQGKSLERESSGVPPALSSVGSTSERLQRIREQTASQPNSMSRGGIGSTSERLERIREHTKGPGSAVSSFGLAPKLPSEREAAPTVQRSTDSGPTRAGETQVPDSVRGVISSPGQSLDSSIQRTIEDRVGDSFGDVRIHTGPQAARACDEINARAFTVGNHIAFNAGEYDPSSAEGQHVLVHELAHVRQQTGGAISMLPQENVALEIDPDPQLEWEAEETAQRVMSGEALGIQRLKKVTVHVQRAEKTRREVLRGDVSLSEASTGLEEAELNPVDFGIDPDKLRDAYKYAEHLTTAGSTIGITQALVTQYNLSQPEAIAITLAVGGAIHVGKDRLHRNDHYLIYEIAKLFGAEERALAFFERINSDVTEDMGDSTDDPYTGGNE